jgi:nitroreductase
MDAMECIATRRSIRRFLNVSVDHETIMTVVEAGSLAPSSGNIQDWKFIVVDNKELMKEICEHSLGQECVYNASFLVVICADPEQTELNYGLRGERLYTVQNSAAAAENMLLAAHALGLGGVWVGAFDEEKMRELLSIPRSSRPQAILAFGYPDEIPDHKRIKDMTTTTYFNGYGQKIKNVHRVLNDYSLDWEARLKQARTVLARVGEKAQKATRKATKELEKKSGSFFHKYKEQLKKNIESKRK